jgi:hypothetical protein
MAISVFMRFYSSRDTSMLYDSVIKEMGRHQGSLPAGEIYHVAARASGGGLVADLWEGREAFDAFAKTALIPLTAKRGIFSPEVEFCDVWRTFDGGVKSTRGVVALTHLDGNVEELLSKSGELEKKLGFPAIPDDLIFTWLATRSQGICYTGHWGSRENAEKFINGPLAQGLRSLSMPPARVEFFDVYNIMDGRSIHA